MHVWLLTPVTDASEGSYLRHTSQSLLQAHFVQDHVFSVSLHLVDIPMAMPVSPALTPLPHTTLRFAGTRCRSFLLKLLLGLAETQCCMRRQTACLLPQLLHVWHAPLILSMESPIPQASQRESLLSFHSCFNSQVSVSAFVPTLYPLPCTH